MGAKNQALKNAARRRMAETGQPYEAALKDVRREYEQGKVGAEEDQARMGFGEAAGTREYRPPTAVTGYFCAWGAEELFGAESLRKLVEHAEKHGQPDAYDKLLCFLCDKPIVVTQEREVHIGLALREVQRPGEPRPMEASFPVWTHEACGHTRVWSWSQITLERRRRGLPVETADLPPQQRRRGSAKPVEDYYVWTVPQDSPPVFYLQPGQPHRHGELGFRADRLSDGLPPLDLSRQDPRSMPEWSIAADRSGLLYVERQGTGRWYQPPTPWSPPPNWLAAAHYHQQVIFLTAPANSVPTQRLEAGTGDLSELLAVGRGDMLFGAQMPVTGIAGEQRDR